MNKAPALTSNHLFLKRSLPLPAFIPALVAALMVALIPMLTLTGCGGGDSGVPGQAVPLKPINEALAKHTEVLKATLKRNTIYKPAYDLFNSAADGEKVGTFAIPQIGIKDKIIQGTTDEDIAMGGAHLESTAMPGMGSNFVIAGDRVLYSAPLLRAEQLQAGDEILVEMPYAKFLYRVEQLTTIDPEDVSILQPKGYDTVMFSTCDPLWQISTRIIVIAKMVEAEARA